MVSLLCEKVNLNEEIIREKQKEIVTNVIKNIDQVYGQIKKNEESPGTDYLFKNIKSSNFCMEIPARFHFLNQTLFIF